jgi:hypothetical protein
VSLLAMGFMVMGAGGWSLVAARHDDANARDPATLCPRRGEPPTATLVLIDGTDPLAKANGARFVALMNRLRDETPRNGRLIVAAFDGDLGHPLDVKFDWCSPGKGSETNAVFEGPNAADRSYREHFAAPLDRAIKSLADTQTSPRSPIAEQVIRAVNDPALPWRAPHRSLVVLSDGIENTPAMSPYRGDRFVLPMAPPRLLSGVAVSYIELDTPRDSALQTPEARHTWAQWFTNAGATDLKMFAPGYPPPG